MGRWLYDGSMIYLYYRNYLILSGSGVPLTSSQIGSWEQGQGGAEPALLGELDFGAKKY